MPRDARGRLPDTVGARRCKRGTPRPRERHSAVRLKNASGTKKINNTMAQTPPQPLRERRCASFGEPAQARSPLPRRASRPRAESDCTWSPKKRALIVVQTSWLQDHEQTCLPRLREIGTEASQGRTRLRVVVDRKRRTTVSIDVTALLGFFVLSSCLITTTALRFTPSSTPRGPSLGASAVVGAPSAPFYPSAQPEPTYPAPLRATLTLDRATKYLDDKARTKLRLAWFAARAHRGQRKADALRDPSDGGATILAAWRWTAPSAPMFYISRGRPRPSRHGALGGDVAALSMELLIPQRVRRRQAGRGPRGGRPRVAGWCTKTRR